VLQSKLDRLINMVFVTGESRNKRSKYHDDSSSVSSDSAADSSSYVADDGNENYSMFRDIIENELDAFEMRILANLSDSRDSSIRFTQGKALLYLIIRYLTAKGLTLTLRNDNEFGFESRGPNKNIGDNSKTCSGRRNRFQTDKPRRWSSLFSSKDTRYKVTKGRNYFRSC